MKELIIYLISTIMAFILIILIENYILGRKAIKENNKLKSKIARAKFEISYTKNYKKALEVLGDNNGK